MPPSGDRRRLKSASVATFRRVIDARLAAGGCSRIESSHRLEIHVDYIGRLAKDGAAPSWGSRPMLILAPLFFVWWRGRPIHLLGTWPVGFRARARYDIDSARLPPSFGGPDGVFPKKASRLLHLLLSLFHQGARERGAQTEHRAPVGQKWDPKPRPGSVALAALATCDKGPSAR